MINKIKEDQFNARKNKEALKASILTTLYSEANMIGKNDGNRKVTDEEVIRVIQKFLKGVNETIALLEGFAPSDNLIVAKHEKAILESYLPHMAKSDDVKTYVESLIAMKITKIGDLMKALKEKFGSTLDGKVASNIIKTALETVQ